MAQPAQRPGDEVAGGIALDDLNVQFAGAVAESPDLFDGPRSMRLACREHHPDDAALATAQARLTLELPAPLRAQVSLEETGG